MRRPSAARASLTAGLHAWPHAAHDDKGQPTTGMRAAVPGYGVRADDDHSRGDGQTRPHAADVSTCGVLAAGAGSPPR
jgi:hypothetical protein